MSFNKIIIVGNLGKDPELRYTPQGTSVTSFTIATNERKKVEGEQQDVTTWFKVTVWGKQAETCAQYLTKGRKVYLEGRLSTETWTDRDGKERTTLAVNATDVRFIDSAPSGEGGGQQSGGGSRRSKTPAASPDIEDDDIPF